MTGNPRSTRDNDFVKVARANDEAEAELLQGLLRTADVGSVPPFRAQTASRDEPPRSFVTTRAQVSCRVAVDPAWPRFVEGEA